MRFTTENIRGLAAIHWDGYFDQWYGKTYLKYVKNIINKKNYSFFFIFYIFRMNRRAEKVNNQ